MCMCVCVLYASLQARSQEQAKERAVVRGAKKEASIGKRMETHMLEQASEM